MERKDTKLKMGQRKMFARDYWARSKRQRK